MSGAPVVIVGGGPAGFSCARGYRERGGSAPVLILGEETDPPYERPPLSKELLRGSIGREQLPLAVSSFYADRGIELRTDVRVASLDPQRRWIETAGGESIAYEACVLATGARPAVPPLPGVESTRVATLRRIGDCERLGALAGDGVRVLVVGSGFIGCEAALSIAARGATVTLATMERVPQEERLGSEVGERIAGWLREAGVELVAAAELAAIEPRDDGALAQLGGRDVEADLVLLALGIDRNSELGEGAGLGLAEDAISTDERMRTDADGVLAAGDVAMAYNARAARPLRVEHWGEALRQGEIAGATLAGDGSDRWEQAPGFWSGLGERTVKYVAWGDGFDAVQLTDHAEGGFTARYVRDGELVGVLTHMADEDYERGRELVEGRASWT